MFTTRILVPPVAQHEFWGVTFPDWLPFFDCRCPEDVIEKDPSGQVTVYSCEKAEYALGLRSYAERKYHATTIVSVQAYLDARNETDYVRGEYIRILRDLIVRGEQQLKLYNSIDPTVPTNGGGCIYRPVAVTLANFGASLLADERNRRIQAFRS